MKKFFNYLEEIRKQKKLTKTGAYLSVFAILLFLSLAITLPNYFLQKQQMYKGQSASQPASALAAGNTYYVATNGNNSNSCAAAQNSATPKRNIMGAGGG